MRIQIQNFRGLSDLTADIDGILLLAGNNGAGKSSACSAIAAAASGVLLPFEGLTKKSAGLLVKDGEQTAMALLNTGDGIASVTWPAVERATDGRFADASAVAVGLEDITAMKPVERAARLIELIGAKPTEEQILAAMKEAKIPDEYAPEVAKALARGWDGAHAHFKDGGAKFKGKWEAITGQRYGKSKVIGWRPDGWKLHLEGCGIDFLKERVAEDKLKLEQTISEAGASQVQREEWQARAEALPKSRRGLDEAKADQANAESQARLFSAALDKLGAKPVLGAKPLQCPCCGALMRMAGGVLVAADDAMDAAAAERAISAYDEAEARLTKARATRDMAANYVRAAQAKVDAGEAAEKRLADAKDGSTTSEDVANARELLEVHQRDLLMAQGVIDAAAVAEKIQHIADIVDLLAPDGLRQAVLVEKLAGLNGMLVDCCREAAWSPVHIDADMAISYGGRPISLCSAGEQYRARVIVQIVVAALDKSPLLVIDGADILDRAGRNGLLRLLNDRCGNAIVGMTILKREEMPDLARAGIGKSVWIENGTANAQMKAAAN